MDQNSTIDQKIEAFLVEGCGRCDFYRTPQCKVIQWNEVLIHLRDIVLESALVEEFKWSQPCYTYQGKNVIIISALKSNAFISFFKGSLLADKYNVLKAPGENSQSGRYMPFDSVAQVESQKAWIREYIAEAIELEKQGKKVAFKTESEPIPVELEEKFAAEPDFEKAFHALTPGRKRGYLLHFNQAKQSATRTARIEKYAAMIRQGKGMHDDFK